MHALSALDVFARSGSVASAAEVLGVTRSAVSHRLAMLEDIVGFNVVRRSGARITLTSRGRQYAEQIRKSLAILTNAQADPHNCNIQGTLRISSVPGFASMWLCKHIVSFHSLCPNLNIEIRAANRLDDVSAADVDIFIAYGDGRWTGRWVKHIYSIDILPVCSPSLIHARGGLSQPSDLLRFPLLHLEGTDEWARWLEANQISLQRTQVGITFSDMMLVQIAAVAGQGIMIGDEVTCAGALAEGQLICPFNARIKPRGGYYLVGEPGAEQSPSVVAFSHWLETLILHNEVHKERPRKRHPLSAH